MRHPDILSTIGDTPLVELARFQPKAGVRVFAKLEGQNPSGSVKDRIVRSMLDEAERSGRLSKDKTLLEATSGNTGISLAMIAGRRGYRVKVVMPDSVSVERRDLLHAFGAEVVITDGSRGTNGAIELAQRMVAESDEYHMLYQYGNRANPQAHYETTGSEIVRDLPEVDVFVAGLGTGGTLMGVSRRLKEHRASVQVVAVVPHPEELVQGLRSLDEGFIPPIIDLGLVDARIVVRSLDAFAFTRELMERERIFAGISAGAVLKGALRYAERMEHGNIVILLADGGWKYLSTGLWTKPLSDFEGQIENKVWW